MKLLNNGPKIWTDGSQKEQHKWPVDTFKCVQCPLPAGKCELKQLSDFISLQAEWFLCIKQRTVNAERTRGKRSLLQRWGRCGMVQPVGSFQASSYRTIFYRISLSWLYALQIRSTLSLILFTTEWFEHTNQQIVGFFWFLCHGLYSTVTATLEGSDLPLIQLWNLLVFFQ